MRTFGLLAVLLISLTLVSCSKKTVTKESDGMMVSSTGLRYQDLIEGQGVEAKSGDEVVVHYVGTLDDGTQFDSSKDRNKPITFQLGSGRVIRGWDEGLVGMKVGGKRRLVIPPSLGYGANPPAGSKITPNATLHFDVELVDVRKPR